MSDELTNRLSQNIASNLRFLRERRGLSQARLSSLADIPRSTIANIESGSGNPTLSNLSRLSAALQISIEELLSPSPEEVKLYPAETLESRREGRKGEVLVTRLIPDPTPGSEMQRLFLPPGSRFVGVPHRAGTREYLFCERGVVTLQTPGARFDLNPGDLCAFRGDQRHSYINNGQIDAVAFGVVVLSPL